MIAYLEQKRKEAEYYESILQKRKEAEYYESILDWENAANCWEDAARMCPRRKGGSLGAVDIKNMKRFARSCRAKEKSVRLACLAAEQIT